MFDPTLIPSVTATMRAIQKDVAYGYTYYVTGKVPVDRVQALANRFFERYSLGLSKDALHGRRRNGKACFKLHLYPLPGGNELQFWLLRTEGAHPLLSLENWRDSRTDRIHWAWWYELIRLPVPVRHREKYSRQNGALRIKPVTWTWQIRADQIDQLRQQIRHLVHHRDDRLAQLIRSLQSVPCHRGCRTQVRALLHYIADQHRRSGYDVPALPKTIRWIGRVRYSTVCLSTVVRRARTGHECWFP